MRTVFGVEVFDGYGVDRFAVTPFIGRDAVAFCCCLSHWVKA
jgi:hypothetical protein